MTQEEWIEENFVKPDLDYLKKCGFEIEIKKNDNITLNSEYKFYVWDGKDCCIFSSPYKLEQAVKIIKMYRSLTKRNKNK